MVNKRLNMRGRPWLQQRGQIFLILAPALVDSAGSMTTLFLKTTHVHMNRAKDLLKTSRSRETYRAFFSPQENRFVYFFRFSGSQILKIQICICCAESFRSVNSLHSCIVIVSLKNPIFVFWIQGSSKETHFKFRYLLAGHDSWSGNFRAPCSWPGSLPNTDYFRRGKIRVLSV